MPLSARVTGAALKFSAIAPSPSACRLTIFNPFSETFSKLETLFLPAVLFPPRRDAESSTIITYTGEDLSRQIGARYNSVALNS